jgi:hypothetical protein
MSQRDFIIRRKIEALQPPFAAIIMAAFRKADSTNAKLLQDAFPEIWAEFYDRYWNGNRDGFLPGETIHEDGVPPTPFESKETL